jgi:hypothetical protein
MVMMCRRRVCRQHYGSRRRRLSDEYISFSSPTLSANCEVDLNEQRRHLMNAILPGPSSLDLGSSHCMYFEKITNIIQSVSTSLGRVVPVPSRIST